MSLKDKTVIYIGGFGGIGRKCIEHFLKKSIKHLFIFDYQENPKLLNFWQESNKACTIDFVQLDITKMESIEAAYQQAKKKLDFIDVVVNGCGLQAKKKLDFIDVVVNGCGLMDRFIDRTIDINLRGVIHSSLIALNYMDQTKGGRGGVIANISSVAGLEASGMFAVYSAAKHGVTAFNRSMSNPLYFKNTGVNFITICPGLTETPLLDWIKDKTLREYAQSMVERFAKLKTQSADVFAENLIKAIEVNKLGSVWLLDLGEMKEVDMPTLWKPTQM